MSAAIESVSTWKAAPSPKREQVLDAAETCFVRSGFHRATMQDIAREAAMSPANIYRYFDSKEAVVLGLAERERERGVALVEEMARAGDRRGALMGIIECYFARVTRANAVLQVEIWAEASRNAAIAAMVKRGEDEARCWFVSTLAVLATSSHTDPAALYETLDPVMKGIIVNRALLADYDPAPAVAQLRAQIDAGLAGSLVQTLGARS